MTLVLAAHGTQDPRGALAVRAMADRLRARLPGVEVEVAYADVREPDVTSVLRAVSGHAVVVPAFLAAGYHVRTDIPEQIAASGKPDVVLAAPLGPAPALVGAMHDRLVEAGWLRGDEVVLAAAGSSDPRALADVRRAATLLGIRTGSTVRVGYVATARPSIVDAVGRARRNGGRVAVASWLLAPGLFHRAVAETSAAVIAQPIGAHPRLVSTLSRRYLGTRCYHPASAVADLSLRDPAHLGHPLRLLLDVGTHVPR
ncbi:MAG: sirohydrochlorin chelatase [Pseudonocardiaceae bacterium]|nr:sirohydrochlorin chelatase [Pseudonocardiaceae bacterium]